MEIEFGYSQNYFNDFGLKIPINVGISTHPHALITGSSGSGKSQALLFLIGKLLQADPSIILHICDFKKSEDFVFLENYENYFAGDDCYKGIMDFYATFSEIRESGKAECRHLLIVDEYPALLNFLQMKDKAYKTKKATDILGAVAEILMLGRGIQCGVWIVTQRPDSTLFANGARDNFMIIIALGRLSKEQRNMIFSGEEIPEGNYSVGEGLMLADGRELEAVKYPLIADVLEWKEQILRIVQRCVR